MNNAYTNYYKELCPNEESWVHTQLSNEREELEDEIVKLRAEVAEWQRINLELHHAIGPTDGETLLGKAQTLRNEIDALNESILVQQIFSDDRIRAVEAEAELKASRYETVKAAQEGLRECIRAERAEAELSKERARLRIVEEFMLRRHIPQAEDDYPQIWLGNGYFDTLADAADAAIQTSTNKS